MVEENKKEVKHIERPSLEDLRAELKRENNKKEYSKIFRNTIVVLVVVAALSVLISSFFVTVLKVTGESMSPTLESGQIVLASNSKEFEAGELIAFYYNNKVLIKRVIGSPGDWINIDSDGNVYVNGVLLEETYLTEKSLTPTDITFPYQVPENRYFVLGDHRSVSIDSRSTTVGCVSEEQLIGKVLFRLYPINVFGKLSN